MRFFISFVLSYRCPLSLSLSLSGLWHYQYNLYFIPSIFLRAQFFPPSFVRRSESFTCTGRLSERASKSEIKYRFYTSKVSLTRMRRPPRNIYVYIFIFFSCSVHSRLNSVYIFFPSNSRPGFLMSREKYYTHAVGQRQKYYEAEGILLVLVDKRALHNPQFYYEEEKSYDITLYFARFGFSFSFFVFLRSNDGTEKEENCFLSCRLMKAERK